jgi:HAD superfamily hydrolase (TIGR01509 family)
VDGKPRHDGVAAFLAARSIDLPLGTAEDGSGLQTQHALGNLKDQYFVEHLRQHGVEPNEDAIALVETLRAQDVSVAVVSSSNNSAEVLDAAGITQLFDVRVDGRDISRLPLHGKPAPDAFLEAARRLGVQMSRAVVVDDAAAGVAAGHAGGLGCVIGVDRGGGQSRTLREAGADVVVAHLGQVHVAPDPPTAWSLVYEVLHPNHEGIRESLCTPGSRRRGSMTAARVGARALPIHCGPLDLTVRRAGPRRSTSTGGRPRSTPTASRSRPVRRTWSSAAERARHPTSELLDAPVTRRARSSIRDPST